MKCCNCNWDNVLAYPTLKVVRVKDRYLGTLRLIFLFFIFAYIIGYILLFNGGYNECIVPNGAIRLSLRRKLGFISQTNYSYCSEYNGKPDIMDPRPCSINDASDVYKPVDQSSAMFITTRYSKSLEKYNSECANGCSHPWLVTNSTEYNDTEYYVAAIDDYTIQLSHFFQARKYYLENRKHYYSQSCKQMKGKLINSHGHPIIHFENNATDILRLSSILKAAKVDLNDDSDVSGRSDDESMRYGGIALIFGIDYVGVYPDPVEYTYTVTRVPRVEYKVVTTTIVDVNKKLVTDRHGVKIFFIFSGQICRFDFQTMLIQAVSGLGLLGMATLMTDMMMIYIMPLKRVYADYKFKATLDHNKMANKLSTHQLQHIDDDSELSTCLMSPDSRQKTDKYSITKSVNQTEVTQQT